MSGGAPARRAVLRWALRLFRREWRQQALVLALLTVAVAAAVAGSVITVNAASDSVGEYGSATALLRLDGRDPAVARSGIADARQRFGTIDVIAHAPVAVPGSIRPLDERDQDPDGPYSRPMLALRRGRYPAVAGEAALTRSAAALLDAAVGSTVTLGSTRAAVVGIVENPADLGDSFALVAPGTLAAPASYTVLLVPGHDGAVPTGVAGQTQFQFYGAGSSKGAIAAVVLAAVTLAMTLVGLIAAAAFVVVAQRRQRQLGLLSAIGAGDRHVRLVLIANGAIVGVVASVVGTTVGILGWVLAAPAVESAANHRIGRFDLPWLMILAIVALAMVIATVAAWWPAHAASRVPVMAALSGRPPRPQPVHRSLVVALVLAVGAVAAIAIAQPRSEHVRPLLLIAGLLALVVGTVFAAPAAIRGLGACGRRLPFAPRLAVRDLARYQARAAAALAAITLGLGIAVAVVGVASASEEQGGSGNLSTSELLIQVGDPRTAPDPGLTADQRAQLDQRAASVVAAVGYGATPVPLDVAFSGDTANDANVAEPVALGVEQNAHSIELFGYPYVATPEVLALYGVDPASILSTTDVLTSRDTAGFILTDPNTRPDTGAPSPVQRVGLPAYMSAPNSLITPAAMQRNGWLPARAAWIVESPQPLTTVQIGAARAAAAAAGLALETRDTHQDGLSTLRTGATLVGALLAMAIVAMTIGLIRGESTRDIRTLTAVGAGPGTRRALSAMTAAALAGLGVLLGMASAYVALIAVFHGDLGRLVPVPVTHLLALAVGVPLAASLAGWLVAGREPRSFARQALD